VPVESANIEYRASARAQWQDFAGGFYLIIWFLTDIFYERKTFCLTSIC